MQRLCPYVLRTSLLGASDCQIHWALLRPVIQCTLPIVDGACEPSVALAPPALRSARVGAETRALHNRS